MLAVVDPFIRPVIAKRNIPFMREVSFAAGWHDPTLLIGLACGLPAMGWACKAPTMPAKWAPPEISLKDLENDIKENNEKILWATRPSSYPELDLAAWKKTQEELYANVLVGPL